MNDKTWTVCFLTDAAARPSSRNPHAGRVNPLSHRVRFYIDVGVDWTPQRAPSPNVGEQRRHPSTCRSRSQWRSKTGSFPRTSRQLNFQSVLKPRRFEGRLLGSVRFPSDGPVARRDRIQRRLVHQPGSGHPGDGIEDAHVHGDGFPRFGRMINPHLGSGRK